MKQTAEEAAAQIVSAFGEEEEFLRTLAADVEEVERLLALADSPPLRRALVRATFAEVEGWTHRLAERARLKSQVIPAAYSEKDCTVLFAKSANGFKDGTKDTLKLLALRPEDEQDVYPEFGDVGWRHLRDSQTVRNRLMHPKRLAHLTVTDEELDRLRQGRSWLRSWLEEQNRASLDGVTRAAKALASLIGCMLQAEDSE